MTQIYTYDEIMAINNPDLSNKDLNLALFFKEICTYPISKEMRIYYPNKFNIVFGKRRSRIRPKAIHCTDPEILKNIRVILSKLSPQNYDMFLEKLRELLRSEKIEWDSVALKIYEGFIDNVDLLYDVYIKLLLDLEGEFPKLIHRIHKYVIDEVNNPQQFDKDSFSETAIEKIKRWELSNGVIIMRLHNKKIYSHKFVNWAIQVWIERTNIKNYRGLEILVKICPLLRREFMNPELLEKLNKMSHNKEYPNRLRLLINVKRDN